jgi:transcription initiation factor TFIID subunit TAF12
MTMGDELFHSVRRRLKKMAEGVLSEMAGGGGATSEEEEDDRSPAASQQQQQQKQQQQQQVPETGFEFYSDGLLATAFLVTAIIAAKR